MSISETLTALYPNAPTLELRIFVNGHGQIDSGYFNDYAKLEKIATKYNGTSQIYYTINPTNPALIARAANRVITRAQTTTTDKDILTRKYLPLDFDPIRPKGISSTDAEHKAARNAALDAKKYLTDLGWPQPIEADSGNGAYLYYAIDLPNDDASTDLIKRCLYALDTLFSTDVIKVDTSMFNAGRIIRLPETLNTKGDNIPDRPHRKAQVLEIPQQVNTVPIALLQALASGIPSAPESKPIAERFILDNYLIDNDLTFKKDRWQNNAYKYALDHCPFNPEHINGSAAIVQFDSGAIVFRCFHDSCSKLAWKDVTKKFPLPESGKTKSAKILAALNDLGYYFRLNQCADRIEVNGLPINDALEAKLLVQMTDIGFKNPTMIVRTMYANAFDNSFHPIQDYLNGLDFDGNDDYIKRLSEYLHDVHAPLNGYPIAYLWLKRWLIGVVAKVFEAEQNPMLVLDGSQGLGKSEFARYLCSSMPTFYLESDIDPSDDDHKLRLIQSWIWEVGELGATTRKADIEALKHFITQRAVTVRRPYGHYDMHKPALASFIGTINDDGSGFLNDVTGNRRFLTMTLDYIDWGYRAIPIDRVWAQAVYLYRHGERFTLDGAEKEYQQQLNQNYEVDDPYMQLLLTHFVIDPSDQTCWTPTNDIINVLQQYGNVRGSIKQISMELSKAAKRLKLQKARQRGLQGYHGITPKIVMNFAKAKAHDTLQG